MIKTDFHPSNKNEASMSSFFALPNVLFGLNFGVLGAISNAYFSLNFFGEFTLYFGQIFVLLCLVTRGLNTALISVLITSSVMAYSANDPYLILILSLEAIVVHVAMRKGYFLFQAAMSYWLIIGIPLLLLLNAATVNIDGNLLFVQGVTRAINGLICVSIVAICCWFLPADYTYHKYTSRPPKLASLIFSLCLLTVTLPALIISLFFIWQTTTNNEQSLARNLENVANQSATLNDLELQRHINGLTTVASIISSNPNTRLQPLIAATEKNYEFFSSLIITDTQGNVTRAAPIEYSIKLNELDKPNISDRDYFKVPRRTLQPFVSDGFYGIGFGDNLLIGMAAPIVVDGRFNGLVQGSIDIADYVEFNQTRIPDRYKFVVTDNKNRIIARSQDLSYSLMSNFDYVIKKDPLISQMQTLVFADTEYLYHQSKTSNGWTISLMISPEVVKSMLLDYLALLLISTIVVLTGFAFIANALSRKITKPLVDIAEHLPNTELHHQIIEESKVSSEMVKLTRKLIDSQEVMTNFHEQLSEQVHNKTKQLKQLNKELYSIAQKDPLTQLLNRAGFNRLAITSYRNCIRNHINMSLIFMDIDHFKRINDTYGHPFGDKCIIAVAKTIQKHCKRDTDILGRYGGEEFIIMIVGGEIEEHKQRVQLIKNEIQNINFENGESQVSMTISAGICSLEDNFAVDYEDVLELADNQLYMSKREGRNRINAISR